jgi:hypothetical protein
MCLIHVSISWSQNPKLNSLPKYSLSKESKGYPPQKRVLPLDLLTNLKHVKTPVDKAFPQSAWMKTPQFLGKSSSKFGKSSLRNLPFEYFDFGCEYIVFCSNNLSSGRCGARCKLWIWDLSKCGTYVEVNWQTGKQWQCHVITDIRLETHGHMNNCRINEISIKLKQ